MPLAYLRTSCRCWRTLGASVFDPSKCATTCELQFSGDPKNRSGRLLCRPKRFCPRELKLFIPLKTIFFHVSQARIKTVLRGRLQRAICWRKNPPYSVGFFASPCVETLRYLRRCTVTIFLVT